MARGKKQKIVNRSGYKPDEQALETIQEIKQSTGVAKTVIRDCALRIGLNQIKSNPSVLLEKAA